MDLCILSTQCIHPSHLLEQDKLREACEPRLEESRDLQGGQVEKIPADFKEGVPFYLCSGRHLHGAWL